MAIGLLLGVLCIVAINAVAPRVRVAPPLLLVVLGVAVSVQPFVRVPHVVVPPELVLVGVLPLLLFAAAVSMPATNFRRNFGAIGGLSVTLVALTSLALGLLFDALLPGLGFAGGVALGAVISPTDAVATSIVKRIGVAPRVVAVLDGEAMLNDASALVILRTALAAVAATGAVGVGRAVGAFALSVVVASAIGVAVGLAALSVRKRIREATVNTLVSFAVPFVAYLPAEHAGASGLVAVVAAGLVIGQMAPRYIAPSHRINERINWHTIEMLLEGGLFLLMGLQLVALLDGTHERALALRVAGAALAVTLGARALYVVPLLASVRKQQRRYESARGRLEEAQHATPDPALAPTERAARTAEAARVRARRVLADADYGAASPLGRRDAALLVWAGMRGAITVAAANTLPENFPRRSLLLLVAFLVATASLLLQGGTLAWVVRVLRFPPPDETAREQERAALAGELEGVGRGVLDADETRAAHPAELVAQMKDRLAARADDAQIASAAELIDRVFDAQRAHVLAARRDGVYSTEALGEALRRVDAQQIGFRLAKRGRVGDDEE